MIGVIADDLTGAAELGAVGLRHGLSAEIVRHGRPGDGMDLVCVDTDSRACDPDEAAKRAAAAARLLQNAGATWIYKKVDSVLRGHVTAEIEAVLKQLKLMRALLLPANPSLGRTIKDGHYFLRGRPIHKTEFARDPHFPRRSSQVLRLVKIPESFSMRMMNGDRSMSDGTIVIGDAESPADVHAWTASCDAQMLPAGGSEFFNALLEVQHPAPENGQTAFPAASGHELFVVGTSTQSARKFIAAAKRTKTPVFSLPQELVWGAQFAPEAIDAVAQRILAALAMNPRVILCVGLPQVRDNIVAQRLSHNVVSIAEQVLKQTSIARVFAEGGATAAELVRRMGWARLEVVRELAPGVATLAINGDTSFLFTIKPGSYSWPSKWT